MRNKAELRTVEGDSKTKREKSYLYCHWPETPFYRFTSLSTIVPRVGISFSIQCFLIGSVFCAEDIRLKDIGFGICVLARVRGKNTSVEGMVIFR